MKRQLFSLVIILFCAAGTALWTREEPAPVPHRHPAREVTSSPQRQSSFNIEALKFELPKIGPQLEIVPGEEWFMVTLTNHGPQLVKVPLLGTEGDLKLDEDLHFTTMDGDRPNHRSWCGNGLDFRYFTLAPGQSAKRRFRREALPYIGKESPAIIHVTVEARIDGAEVTVASPPVEVSFHPLSSQYWEAQESDEGYVTDSVQISSKPMPSSPSRNQSGPQDSSPRLVGSDPQQ